MTEHELRELIENAVDKAVEKAIDPLKQQQTEYLARILKDHGIDRQTDPEKKGIGAARLIRALAAGGGDMTRAINFCNNTWDDSLNDAIVKALGTNVGTGGGFLVPEQFSSEIIELLRARAVVRGAGPIIIPMNGGTMTIPKQTGGATSNYIGENATEPSTEQTFGDVVLTFKKLRALVPISNDLLRFGVPQVDTIVRDDLVASMALHEDLRFLRGDGTQNDPKGLRNWVNPANVSTSNGTSLAAVRQDLNDLVTALEENDVRMNRPHWFMHPRTKNYLLNRMVDSNGNLVFRAEMLAGTLMGFPFSVTTQLPTNLSVTSTNADETELYLVDMADTIIGESSELEIAVSSDASYQDAATGAQHSAFDRDQTLMRAIARHDFAVRHDLSIAIKSDLVWGST